jgi:hypothetical protein
MTFYWFKMNVLTKAIQEENKRTNETFAELASLFNKVKNKEVSIKAISNKLKVELKLFKDLEIPSAASFALKTHKMVEILGGAIDLLNSFGDKVFTQHPFALFSYTPDAKANFSINNIAANSTSLFLTANYYTALHQSGDKDILNPLTSSLIQGVKTPSGFSVDSIFSASGELLVLNKGYFFGGSRSDEKYLAKELKAEDCSSAIAKWLGSKIAFSTIDMKNHYEHLLTQSEVGQELNGLITPIGKKEIVCENLEEGDIYMFRTKAGGHTGVVSKIVCDESQKCFEGLSYSRNMPLVDGLGYSLECPQTNELRDYFFFRPTSVHDEL